MISMMKSMLISITHSIFEGPGGKASKEEASFAADHQGLVDDAVYVRR